MSIVWRTVGSPAQKACLIVWAGGMYNCSHMDESHGHLMFAYKGTASGLNQSPFRAPHCCRIPKYQVLQSYAKDI